MKLASRLLASLFIWTCLTTASFAGEDFFTTDFQFDLQPRPGLFLLYDGSYGIAPSGTTGHSLLNRLGADLCPTPGVDLFVVGHFLDFNFKRTNRYQFSIDGRSIGLRLHALPESRNPVGITVGVMQEENDLGRVRKNGTDLGLISPSESSIYGFLLIGKQIHPRWRLQGGVQTGSSTVGPISGTSWNWNLGTEYTLDKQFSLAANFKEIRLQGLEANDNISLRLNYRPVEDLRIQLRGDYFTKGLTGQLPVVEPLSAVFARRYEQSPSVSVSLQLGYRFGFEGKKTPPADAPKARPDTGTKAAPDAPSPEAPKP